MDLNVTVRVPAAEKLLDYAASGIGSIAGSMLASWQARQQVKARLIEAQGEADSLRMIAEAQSKARAILVAPEASVEGELSIGDTVSQRIQFQEEKRQQNIASVVAQAAQNLGDDDVPDHEPDHDWTARFFDEVQDISSEEMQALWAKILAGEVQRPGSTSIRTLSVLRNLDQQTARLFRIFASLCVSMHGPEGEVLDTRVPSIGGSPGANVLEPYGFGYRKLTVLNEHGLITPDYNSWHDYGLCIAKELEGIRLVRMPFSFQSGRWGLIPMQGYEPSERYRLNGVAFTKAGIELMAAVEVLPQEHFKQALVEFFRGQKLQMVAVNS